MFCPRCGTGVARTPEFCPKCKVDLRPLAAIGFYSSPFVAAADAPTAPDAVNPAARDAAAGEETVLFIGTPGAAASSDEATVFASPAPAAKSGEETVLFTGT